MTKVGVITLHTVCNYGTQLQALATQEKLKEYFDEVEFIDYRRKDTYGIDLLKTFTKGNIIKAPIIMPTLIYWKKVFDGFQKSYLNIGDEKYLTDEDLENFNDKYDAYFTGSDQVWNTGWNNGVLKPMYLSFVKNKPKYGYACSFGKNCLTKEEVENTLEYIKDYKRITVREESGVTILKEQYNYEEAFRILDPTLVMNREFWLKYKPKNKIKEPYILIYNLNRSKEFDLYAKKLAKKTGLKLYRFCTRFDQILRSGKSLVIPNILDFISLVDDARYVLTDSFHATAFSMNLNTEPICVYPKNYGGRIKEFLNLLELEDRHIKDYNDFSILDIHIDFTKVNNILDEERKKVDEYLSVIESEIKSYEK